MYMYNIEMRPRHDTVNKHCPQGPWIYGDAEL
jgi:hypothetical protein